MSRMGKSFLVVLVFACAALTASTHAQVVINEIHYNPPGADGTVMLEFIELHNRGASAVDISNWRLTFGTLPYVFPSPVSIPAGGYVVVAENPASLNAAKGFLTPYSWAGLGVSLDNGGELITLANATPVEQDSVLYDDVAPWPAGAGAGQPDDGGSSIELLNPALDNNVGGSWLASTVVNGTPGAQNSVFTNAPTIQSESPARRTAVASLPSVTVTFSTSVTGVTAGALTVGGSAATSVSGSGAGPYIFSGYAPPASGSVTVALAGAGIVAGTVPFGGDSWTLSTGIVVVINELHYHPFDTVPDAEFLELYNAGGQPVDISGWKFTSGIVGTVPATTIVPGGGYVVFAKVPALLQTSTGYAGAIAWTSGSLSNGGESVTISDAANNVIDSVIYSDSGAWPTPPDGDGPSAELINPALPNQFGGAWRSSLAAWGTPGAVNSTYVAAPPPIINDTKHTPLLPLPNQAITVTALVLDDGALPPTVTLYYRQDFDPTIAYSSTPMWDDGLHGDGAAGDGTFGATVPGLPVDQRLDFTIRADDGTGVSAGPSGNNTLVAGENPAQTYLCKFSNPPTTTDMPHYHLITTQHTRTLQDAHNENEYDGTFVHCNAANSGCVLFYNVVERYRGQSSLNQHPHSFRVNFPASNPLQSEMGFPVKKLNTMSQMPDRQALGYQFFHEAFNHGIPTHVTQPIRYSTTPLSHGGIQDYACNNVEAEDADFTESEGGAVTPLRWPGICTISLATCSTTADCGALGGTCFDRTSGNLYKGVLSADLQYLGTNPLSYQPQYEKQTNETDGIYTDVMALTYALDPDTTSDANFEAAVNAIVDENEWARFFAIQMLLVNQEGGIYRDTGDDYLLYMEPPGSPLGYNAMLLARDQDSVFGGFGTFAQETIWRTNIQTPQRFIRNNAYAGRFVGAICELLTTDFTQPVMDARIDALPAAFADATRKAQFKAWVAARIVYVNNEITRTTTLTGVPASPYQAASPTIALSGQLNQCGTYRVLLNGAPVANYSVYGHTWSASYTLAPGPNQITVQSVDVNGTVLDQATASVLYDPPGTPLNSLRLVMPKRMVNDKTLTLRADILNPVGGIDTSGCYATLGTVTMTRISDSADIPLTVTFFDNHLPVPADSIRFYHGVGSVSFTLDGGAAVPAGDYRVTVTVGTLSASKLVTVVSNPTWRVMPATLSGADLVWGPDENIRISLHDTEIPSGSTLTINPGTMVMVDTTGSLENGTLITVNGQLNAVGSQDNPIHFFSERGPAAMIHTVSGSLANGDAWHGIYHFGSGSSTYKWVVLTGAGNGPITGHPRPPIIRMHDTHNLLAEDDIFVDSTGMMFQTPGVGTYTVRRSLISRVGIGAEFNGSGHTLLLEDDWFTGIGRGPTTPQRYDGDLLHVDGAGSNQMIRRCVVADGGDDGIDHSASTFTVENTIIHDVPDKAMSMTGGFVTLRNVLIFNAGSGVRGTGSAYNTTIAAGRIDSPQTIQETIMWSGSVGACSASINYTDGGDATHVACGTGNISVNPQFVNTAQCDFNLVAGSPALTAGPTGGRIGWLGFPAANACAVNGDCNDNNACTVDTCGSLGVCTFRPIVGCRSCATNTDCSDGNACTTDTCGPLGTCQTSQPANCDDANACTTDSCDTLLGCQHTSPTCDDANACTTDTCIPSSGCQHGTVSCDDANACTTDTCVPATGCQHTAPNCDDGNVCTNDSCIAGACQHTSNTASCSDGNLCTTADVCAGGTCSGTAVSCPIGQTCNSGTGVCQSGPTLLSFQQGASGYTGSVDTYIDTALGSQAAITPIVVDGSPEEQVLLRFDGIFGSGVNQIPAGSTVSSATLTLWVGTGANDQSANAVNFHRLLHAWSDSGLWAAYGVAPWNATGGIQADGVDALAAITATATMTTAATSYPVDVTTSLQAWAAAPSSNFGWAILPTGTDGLRLESSESTTTARRPLLSVTFNPPVTGCTTNAQCDDNNVCNGIETCVATVCQPGTALNCDDGLVCTTDTCSATLGCQHANNTLSCSDGNACTTGDTCAGGLCVPGAATNCDDSNPCTNDSCNTSTGCVHANNTASCSDGNLCTTGDVCSGGTCTGTAVSCPGGSCNPATGQCVTGPVTTSFQDGINGYTGTQDTYLAQAAPTTVAGALDNWRWDTENPAPNQEYGLVRFDAVFGSGAGQVPLGSTIQSATLTVVGFNPSDNPPTPGTINECAVDWSEATVTWDTFGAAAGVQAGDFRATPSYSAPLFTGASVSTPVTANIDVTASVQSWANSVAPNYGWLFTPHSLDGIQVYSAEWGTVAQRPKLTVVYIPPATGCTTNADCSDNNLCNGIETCVSNVCQPGTALNCDDANVCTTDTCSATLGCEHASNTLACSDNNACTTNDTCSGGTCVGGAAPNCDDSNPCTNDSCNTVSGCVHANNTLPCDDGLFCNGHEVCAGGACQAGTPVNCDDGTACTGDSCNETTDACEHTACTVTVQAAGSRWLAVTPPTGLASVALRVTTPGLACLPKYVDANGGLTSSPVFQSSAQWGTVHVGDRPIVPSTAYTVQAEVTAGAPIATGTATTWAWGNANNLDDVNVFDIICVLDGFQGLFTQCTPFGVDQNSGALSHPVTVDLDDILAALDAFSGSAYPDANPCSGAFAAPAGSTKIETLTRPGKDPRIWLEPAAKTVAPGGAVRVDVYAEGLVDVRGYQVAVEAGGGRAGALVPGAVTISTYRDDYLFTGWPVSAVTDVTGVRLAGAVRGGGVTTSSPVYLGSFEYRASRDAAGTFRVSFRAPETMFRDSSNAAERVDAGAVLDIRIGGSPPAGDAPPVLNGPAETIKGVSR